MHTTRSNMTKVDIVRLIFLRHEYQQDSRDQLNLFHRRDAHVEENTVENRHGNDAEEFRQEDRQANEEKDDETCDALLSDTEKLRLLSRCSCFRLQFQSDDMIDRKNGGSHEPWKTENRIDDDTDRHYQQVQMITATFLFKKKSKIGTWRRPPRSIYLQFVLFAIDNHGSDLLVHEDENRCQ